MPKGKTKQEIITPSSAAELKYEAEYIGRQLDNTYRALDAQGLLASPSISLFSLLRCHLQTVRYFINERR